MNQAEFDATQKRHAEENKKFLKEKTMRKFWGTPDERYACLSCGATIMMKKVYWSLHDMGHPVGSGQTSYEGRPYCPRCTPNPNYKGGCLDL